MKKRIPLKLSLQLIEDKGEYLVCATPSFYTDAYLTPKSIALDETIRSIKSTDAKIHPLNAINPYWKLHDKILDNKEIIGIYRLKYVIFYKTISNDDIVRYFYKASRKLAFIKY